MVVFFAKNTMTNKQEDEYNEKFTNETTASTRTIILIHIQRGLFWCGELHLNSKILNQIVYS